ncbi:MAG: CRTAC1 family protein, partial [bacterium]
PGGLDPAVAIPEEKFASDYDIGKFPDVAMALGISRMNLAGGTIIEDFDEDGFLDIVISTANPWGQMLYYKNEGDGTFSDRTEEAGLLGQLGGLNLIHADYDNDGWRDILVLRGGWMGTFGRIPCSLLRNRGDGTFTDVTKRAGLAVEAYPCQAAAFADYDLDGDLDLFFGSETPPPESGMKYPCELFRNEGDGRFVDVAAEAGVENLKLAKGVAWGDFDDDRDPDLYVSNQFDVNRFYRNEGNGKFTNIAEELGVHEPRYSFPAWFWDYDNDGKIDLFVAGYGGEVGDVARSYLRPEGKFALSALYRNEGGSFRDMVKEAGLTGHALAMGANFGDLDNDGWLDFYLGTGAPEFDALMPNQMYRNDGKGGFQDVTTSGGFGNLQKGHGIAWGDVDNDGDQDVFLEAGGIYPYDEYFNSLFQNPGHGNRWLSLELEGVESNRDAIGTRIRVRIRESGRTRDIWRWVWPCGSFGSSSFRQHVGLGQADAIDVVEVYWPKTGKTQTLRGFELDRSYKIVESGAAPERIERRRVTLQTGA